MNSSDTPPTKPPAKQAGPDRLKIPITVKAHGDTQLQTVEELPSQGSPTPTGPPAPADPAGEQQCAEEHGSREHGDEEQQGEQQRTKEHGDGEQRCPSCHTALPAKTIYCTSCGENMAPDPLVGKTFEKRYEVVRRLGAGAMGAVYEVRHLRLNKRFAMKVIHRELTQIPEFVARFEREAHSMSRLQHPNCVTVTDFGQAATGEVFLVMEFLRGTALSELLDAPMPVGTALEITRQILEGLKHAHSEGIIHRDIKPENVMCDQDADGSWQIKVVDFGIAKLPMTGSNTTARITQAGIIFGTPEYMAPEQALSTDVNKEADLYAAGVILWHMLTGRLLFEASGHVEILGTKLSQPAPSLNQAAPGVFAPALVGLLRHTLERDPLKRISSAEEMLAQIHAIQAQPGGGLATSRIPLALRRYISRIGHFFRPALQLYTGWYHGDGQLGPPSWAGRLRSLVTTRHGLSVLLASLGILALAAAPLWLWWSDDGEVPLALPVLQGKGDKAGEKPPASPPPQEELPPKLKRAKKLLAQDSCREASLELKNYVRQHPDQPMGHYLLGAASICRKHYAEGLAAYGKAIKLHGGYRKDARILEDCSRLLRVRKIRNEALTFLTDKVGEPALPILLKVASHSSKATMRRRATEAVVKMGQGDQINKLAALTWEVRHGKTCRERGAAVAKIGQLGDPEAIPILEKLRDERRGFFRRKYRYWCIRKVLIKTIKKLEALK